MRSNRTRNQTTYEPWMVDKSDKGKKLISDFDNQNDALFLEHTLEKELRIEDRPVQGEVKPRK